MSQEANPLLQVIHKDLEPGVINDELLEKLILEQGYIGEAGRLARLELNYSNVTVLRIEFQNLLKINHLFVLRNLRVLSLKFNKLDKIENIEMLTNLVELDLSFNFIEKIVNLETLVKLEILSLFNNHIEKLENLDVLENMLILSIGNNRINTLDGIGRLRFMKKLRVLNLEGNPIASDINRPTSFRNYIAAILPNLKYYNYIHVTKEERDKGLLAYKDDVTQIEDEQLDEIKDRDRIVKELADEVQLSSCFVEFLNEHQLFESMFLEDSNGKILRLIGEEAEELINDYRNEIYELTQEIYKIGLEKNECRLREIDAFQQRVNNTKLRTQQEGIAIVEDCLSKQKLLFGQAKIVIRKIENDDTSINEDDANNMTSEYDVIKQTFDSLMDTTWHGLMYSEIKLFECIDEANMNFEKVIGALLTEFIEEAKARFVQMRNSEINFSGALHEAVAKFITMKAVVAEESTVAIELQGCFDDKSIIGKFILASREYHVLIIDAREERLITRARSWATDLIDLMQRDEIDRNRAKIIEINTFVHRQKVQFDHLHDEVENEIKNEKF